MGAWRLGALGAAIVLLALPAFAAAAPGDLVGQSCFSKTGTEGCAAISDPSMLESAASVAVAPDGSDVYVAAATGVAHFRRAADGTLSYANCVDTNSSLLSACPVSAPAEGNGALSANAINLAISPDGLHLYAVSWFDALVWWTRDPGTGNLTWGGCRDGASDSATNGHCGTATTIGGGNFPAGSMDFAQGVSITPDGQTLYIADQTEGLLQAQLNPTTGAATPKACFNNSSGAAPGCTGLAADVPMAFFGIDAASNSRDVYALSISPGGITHFSRSAGGTTALADCVANGSPTASCATAAPSPTFTNPSSIGVAGDVVFSLGANLATPSGTVGRFGRAADGSLSFQGCATTESSSGPCAILPAQTVSGTGGRLVVAPDASSIYLPPAGISEHTLTRLTGSLAFGSCLTSTGVPGCSAAPLPGPFAAESPGRMALSPDGTQLFQPAQNTLNVFRIEQPGEGALSPPPAPPGPTSKPVAKKPRIRSVKRDKRGVYRVRVHVRQAGTLTARFLGKLKPRGKKRTLGKVARKNVGKPGTYVLKLRPPAAARRLKVKARLLVVIAPPGYRPARATRTVRLK